MYDVAVIGGGISGCMAAIAAARCGASVILIEKYGFLGGTLTACGTGPMMTFHAGDVQVVRGVTNELIERLMNKGFSPGHIFDTTGYTYTVTPFSAEGMKLELEDMMAEAGVELLYHSVVCDVEYENAVINSVEVYGKNGKRCIESRMFVDASGDCDLAFLAGLETNKGREADGKCQPMTMNFKVINVDTDRVKEYIMNNNDEFPRLKSDLSKVTRAPKLSIGGDVKTIKKKQKKIGKKNHINRRQYKQPHTFIYVLKINKCKRTAYKEHRQIRCCTADTGHYFPEYTAEFQSECHHHKCDNKRNRSGIYKIFYTSHKRFFFFLYRLHLIHAERPKTSIVCKFINRRI